MAREKLQTRIRRDQILQAALEIAGAAGLEGLSMGAVAAKVGIVPSALYRHYPSKDAILDALLGEVGRTLQQNVAAACAATEDPLDRLECILVRHVDLLVTRPAISELVFTRALHGGSPERRARLQRGIQAYLDRLAELVNEGRTAGRIREDVEPRAAALALLGVVRGAATLFEASGGAFDARSEALGAWRLLRTALSVHPPLETKT